MGVSICAGCGAEFPKSCKEDRQKYSAHLKTCADYITLRATQADEKAKQEEQMLDNSVLAELSDAFSDDQAFRILKAMKMYKELS